MNIHDRDSLWKPILVYICMHWAAKVFHATFLCSKKCILHTQHKHIHTRVLSVVKRFFIAGIQSSKLVRSFIITTKPCRIPALQVCFVAYSNNSHQLVRAFTQKQKSLYTSLSGIEITAELEHLNLSLQSRDIPCLKY